jgi:integrase
MIEAIETYQENQLTRQTYPTDQNPAVVYIESLESETSKRTMKNALNAITEVTGFEPVTKLEKDGRGIERPVNYSYAFFPWGDLRFQHTASIRARLAEKYSAAQTNKCLSALRQTLKNAWRLGYMDAEDYARATDLSNVKIKRASKATGRMLKSGEVDALAKACQADETPAGARDDAIIGLLYGCGLRRSEIPALNLEDFDEESGLIMITGKGNKTRSVYATNGTLRALETWLEVRGWDEGPLFLPINKGSRMLRERLSPQAVYRILEKRREEAGVDFFSPHDLRRTFISEHWDAGTDGATLADLVGHASVDTTRGYDRRGERRKQQASGRLHYPGGRWAA